jgi:hypothetical protein
MDNSNLQNKINSQLGDAGVVKQKPHSQKNDEVEKHDKNFGLSPIRTYQDDVKNVVERDNISTAKIVMAEQSKKQKKELRAKQAASNETVTELPGIKEPVVEQQVNRESVIPRGGVPDFDTPEKGTYVPKKEPVINKPITKENFVVPEVIISENQAAVAPKQQVAQQINTPTPAQPEPKPVKERRVKKERTPISTAAKKTILVSLLSIIFVAGGSVLIYSATQYIKNRPDPISEFAVQNSYFLNPDTQKIVPSQNKSTRQILNDVREFLLQKDNFSTNDLVEILVTKVILEDTPEGEKSSVIPITARNFFQVNSSNAPESLIRSFADDLMIGLHKRESIEPFVLLKTNDINQTYGGMLEWEKTLVEDVRDIFFKNLGSSQAFNQDFVPSKNLNINDTFFRTITNQNQEVVPEIIIADSSTTTVSTSTPVVSKPEVVVDTRPTYDPRDFKDVLLSNKDARAILNSDSEIILFYSILDNENVIITTNRETLDIVLDKINVAKLIR